MKSNHTQTLAVDPSGVNVIDTTERNYVVAYCRGSTLREVESNARLFAASPKLFSELWNLVNFLEATEKGYCAKELHAATLQRHLESAKAVMAKVQKLQPSPGQQGEQRGQAVE